MKTITIADCKEIAAGITDNPAEQDWLILATGGERHESRVRAAFSAAFTWGKSVRPDSDAAAYAAAYAACVMDANGVGGHHGAGGPSGSSRRHPAFRDYPRKRQAAGRAWTSAIADASGRIADALSVRGIDVAANGDVHVASDGITYVIPFSWLDADWRRSLRRANLLKRARAEIAARESPVYYVEYS